MSHPALPGSHYCEQHQGNHSHYDSHNCEVCKLKEIVRKIRNHCEDMVVSCTEVLNEKTMDEVDLTGKLLARGTLDAARVVLNYLPEKE